MILAGGYQMRAVAETRSFPTYRYKVMINFRTSSFTDCSRVLPGLSLPFLSVSSYVFISITFFQPFRLLILVRSRDLQQLLLRIRGNSKIFAKREVYFLFTDKTACRKFDLPIIASLSFLFILFCFLFFLKAIGVSLDEIYKRIYTHTRTLILLFF